MSNTFSSLSDAYLYFLNQVLLEKTLPEDSIPKDAPKGWALNRRPCRELLNVHAVIEKPIRNVPLTTMSDTRNNIIADYFEKESKLFDTGDVTTLKDISSVWRVIQNPDGTVNANYGFMVLHTRDCGDLRYNPTMRTPWEVAKDELKLCKSTNRAVMHMNRPCHMWPYNLDVPCCMFLQFTIRNDQLNLHATMRSHDIVYGWPFNMQYFVVLMYRMLDELEMSDLKIGNLYYSATSLHMYEAHLEKAKAMLYGD
jgi:hypothetical protein